MTIRDGRTESLTSLQPLAPVLGRWRTTGTTVDDGGFTGTDTYRVLPGDHWIAHDVDVLIGGVRVVTHEMIGGEHEAGGWLMYAFDDAVRPGLMRLSVHDDRTLLIEGDGVRSWFSFRAGPTHMTTAWEQRIDGEWRPWMSVRFDRID